MHEMAIAENLLEIVLDESARHGIRRVDRIVVQVGALAAVVPEALTFCFQAVSQDTLAAGARLDIETVPVVVRCPLCRESSRWKIGSTPARTAGPWCRECTW